MEQALGHLDWSLVRAFLAVAEEGSLSAAARRLRASQPTLGRQVKAMEEALSAKLFARHARGFVLTDMGEAILPAARAMAAAMNEIRLAAAQQEDEVTGIVRITASVNVSHALLPKVFATARRMYPGVQLELVPSDDSENLLYGESDIAVRMYRPTQNDLVTKYIGDFHIGLYGATQYLEERGRPSTVEEIFELDLVGYDADERLINGLANYDLTVDRFAFMTRCDEPLTQWQLIRAGCGVGFAPCMVADADPLVENIPLPVDVPGLPMWLTTSQAMRHTPRIRAIWEIMSRELA